MAGAEIQYQVCEPIVNMKIIGERCNVSAFILLCRFIYLQDVVLHTDDSKNGKGAVGYIYQSDVIGYIAIGLT